MLKKISCAVFPLCVFAASASAAEVRILSAGTVEPGLQAFAQLAKRETGHDLRTTRYPDGAAVMEHVIWGRGNKIGFGAITEIRAYDAKGLKLVGPLPPAVQNYTSYEAAVMTGAGAADAARAVLRLPATPDGKAAFVAAGVD